MSCTNAITRGKDGILLKIHVIPGSPKSVFPSGYNEWKKRIEIKVKAEAKENKANIEVIKTMAEYFDHPAKEIFIVQGQKSRDKTIVIKQMNVGDVCKKIEESLNGL